MLYTGAYDMGIKMMTEVPANSKLILYETRNVIVSIHMNYAQSGISL